MKVTGLFAGIGGIEVGLERAGHETLAFSEVWAPAAAVLEQRSTAPNLGDVRLLRNLPDETSLLTAGFPCQDLSQAGLTDGIDGAKSGLVGYVFELLDRSRVPWVLLENVSFMLRLDGGRAMERLASGFESRGYRWAYRVVNTLSYLPHRRERVFMLASREGDPADVLLVDDAVHQTPVRCLETHAHGFYWTEGTRGLGWGVDCIPTLKNGSTIGIPSPPAVVMPSGAVITPDIRDAERLQGFPEYWTVAAETSASRASRWTLVGNAVSVPVAQWVGSRLIDPGAYERSRDAEFGAGWPKAARWDGSGRRRVVIGDRTSRTPHAPLHEFLRYPGKPLSARATRGFLSRARAGRLRFEPGFLERLDAHLEIVTPSALAA